MKALTVQQPWALLIVAGAKPIENRGVITTHRGPLAIHAGARLSERGMRSPLVTDWWHHTHDRPLAGAEPYLARGAIIGTVTVVDSHYATPGCCPSPWAETTYQAADGSTQTRVAHHVLEDPVEFADPIYDVRGRLGLWTLTPDLADAVARASEPC